MLFFSLARASDSVLLILQVMISEQANEFHLHLKLLKQRGRKKERLKVLYTFEYQLTLFVCTVNTKPSQFKQAELNSPPALLCLPC